MYHNGGKGNQYMSDMSPKEKQESLQKLRDQQNKDRGGPKVVRYTSSLLKTHTP
jgi:hypothetical protein